MAHGGWQRCRMTSNPADTSGICQSSSADLACTSDLSMPRGPEPTWARLTSSSRRICTAHGGWQISRMTEAGRKLESAIRHLPSGMRDFPCLSEQNPTWARLTVPSRRICMLTWRMADMSDDRTRPQSVNLPFVICHLACATVPCLSDQDRDGQDSPPITPDLHVTWRMADRRMTEPGRNLESAIRHLPSGMS